MFSIESLQLDILTIKARILNIPIKAKALINKAIISCNSLQSYFYYTIGQKPLKVNWDNQKLKGMIDNKPKVVKSMKVL